MVFLLVELPGRSSSGAAHSEEARFPESLPVFLLAFFNFSVSLAGAGIYVASAATASRYIWSTQITAFFLSDGMEMTPMGPGIFKVL